MVFSLLRSGLLFRRNFGAFPIIGGFDGSLLKNKSLSSL